MLPCMILEIAACSFVALSESAPVTILKESRAVEALVWVPPWYCMACSVPKQVAWSVFVLSNTGPKPIVCKHQRHCGAGRAGGARHIIVGGVVWRDLRAVVGSVGVQCGRRIPERSNHQVVVETQWGTHGVETARSVIVVRVGGGSLGVAKQDERDEIIGVV